MCVVLQYFGNGKGNEVLLRRNPSEALAKVITTFMNDKALAERSGELSRKFAKERFSQDIMSKNILGLYNSLIEEKGIRNERPN